MNSTRLLLITSEFPPLPGGIGNHAFYLAKELQGKEQEVMVLTNHRATVSEETTFDNKQNFSIHRVRRYSWLPWTYFNRIIQAIKLARGADVILLSGKFSLWIGGLLNLLINQPLVAIVHGSEVNTRNLLIKKYTRNSLRRMDVVICVSKYTLSLLKDIDLKKALVINNGFKIPKAPKQINKEAPSIIRLITVGNVTQRKGQQNVIACLPYFIEEFPTIEYHIVGIPTDKEKIKSQAASLGVSDRVFIYGKVTEEEKLKLLLEATIFIMLSETTDTGDVEGFGIAILEANALGLPAIGSLGCGIEDAIKIGKSGFLVNPKSSAEVIKSIKEIMNRYSLFSQGAKEWSQDFTWDVIGKKYQEVIDHLLQENPEI